MADIVVGWMYFTEPPLLEKVEALRQRLAREGIHAEVIAFDVEGIDWTGPVDGGTNLVLRVADEDEARAAALLRSYDRTVAGTPPTDIAARGPDAASRNPPEDEPR